jgi:hypothetical protein
MIATELPRALRAILALLVLVAIGCATRPTWPYDVQRGRTLADHTDGEGAEERLLLAVSEAERDSARPWGLPISLYYLADLYLRYPRLGKTVQASPLLERSRELWERLVGPRDPAIAVVLLRLSDAKREQGDAPEAERVRRNADAIVTESLPSHHPVRRLRESGIPLEEVMRSDEIFADAVVRLGGDKLNLSHLRLRMEEAPAAVVTLEEAWRSSEARRRCARIKASFSGFESFLIAASRREARARSS